MDMACAGSQALTEQENGDGPAAEPAQRVLSRRGIFCHKPWQLLKGMAVHADTLLP
jgi:hypothetical protein